MASYIAPSPYAAHRNFCELFRQNARKVPVPTLEQQGKIVSLENVEAKTPIDDTLAGKSSARAIRYSSMSTPILVLSNLNGPVD